MKLWNGMGKTSDLRHYPSTPKQALKSKKTQAKILKISFRLSLHDII